MNLVDELVGLLRELEAGGVAYALCGGLAMAVYGHPRATADVDLLVEPGSLPAALQAAARCGFVLPAAVMSFRGGQVVIHRVSKVDVATGDTLPVDFLAATEALQEAWRQRQRMVWRHGELWVVSPEGLIFLKSLRGSPLDAHDVARLRGKNGD